MEIEKYLKEQKNLSHEHEPRIFHLSNPKEEKELEILFKEGKVLDVVDTYENQVEELAAVKKTQKPDVTSISDGVWVYYPWRRTIVHLLDKEEYRTIKTSRDKNLILEDEQKLFENFTIGFAGLNVGNPGAVCIALEGGAHSVKFADFDPLSVSNFNRFRASLSDLGVNKSILTARQAYEIDPYLDIELFEKGIQPDTIDRFLLEPKIDLLIEEMDNLKLKITIREKAKEHKIPVLMVTGNGANVIIDVERYDLDENLPVLNGYLKSDVIEGIHTTEVKKENMEKIILLARDFMGNEYLTPRLQDSFLLVGKELTGIPQLAESSFLRGAALCYFARQIATKQKVPSGRYYLKLDTIV